MRSARKAICAAPFLACSRLRTWARRSSTWGRSRNGLAHASPYSISDYNAIDPEAGTAQDLHDFVAEAHRLHLKVMLDIVYYHTAPDNIMMKEDPSFFVKTQDGKIARGFWPQPLPDYNKPKVRKYLVDSLVHWVRDFGIDGFRCDVGRWRAGVVLERSARGAE